ncbi:MAG: alpha/beta hydrolase [Propionivibrio sp.]
MTPARNLAAGLLAALWLISTAEQAAAGPLRDHWHERQAQRSAETEGMEAGDLAEMGGNALNCADWSRRIERLQERARGRRAGPSPDLGDVAYGPQARQKLDVFLPRDADKGGGAPIILMVHGGGWCVGDKAAEKVIANKVARWTPRGFIVVSINYPMVGDGSDALAQAHHIARAAAFVQATARAWGGDPRRLILMGHSAGAHLVSLVNADASIRNANAVRPILGAVSLDAGAIDVVRQMPNVYPFLKVRYREAFGDAESAWIAASPFHRIDGTAAPWLGVCSTTRRDDPCGQADAYAEKSRGFGVSAAVLPQHRSHGAINADLGMPGDYTRAVEAFMASLDSAVARRLR